jgi:hypothetical protein
MFDVLKNLENHQAHDRDVKQQPDPGKRNAGDFRKSAGQHIRAAVRHMAGNRAGVSFNRKI